LLLNVLWIVLGDLWIAVGWIVAAVLAITIVGFRSVKPLFSRALCSIAIAKSVAFGCPGS
jgi:uncharacterized membrane protein YccF (DUF307 family)